MLAHPPEYAMSCLNASTPMVGTEAATIQQEFIMVKRIALSNCESTSASQVKSVTSKKRQVKDATSTDSLKKTKISDVAKY